jgi:hypothetical protein
LAVIRIWLCSAFRVQQPHRPVSGIPPSPAANRSILALFRPPGKAASVGQRLLPRQLLPALSTLTVLHGEALYFQQSANRERKLLYDLASFRLPASRGRVALGVVSNAAVAAGCPRSTMPPAPGPWPPAPRVTHLERKPSRCVTKSRATAATIRKRGAYNVMNNNSTYPNQMHHPHGVLDRSGEAGLRSLQVVKAP